MNIGRKRPRNTRNLGPLRYSIKQDRETISYYEIMDPLCLKINSYVWKQILMHYKLDQETWLLRTHLDDLKDNIWTI